MEVGAADRSWGDIDLSGTWRAAPSDERRRRSATDDAAEDHDWSSVEVPGHWRTSALGDHPGPVLYRRRFTAPTGPAGREDADGRRSRRRWLVLDGVFSTADVWLDGTYLLDVDGWFFPHEAEVTELLAHRTEHLLALEVACPMPVPGAPRRDLLGAHGTLPPSAYPPAGTDVPDAPGVPDDPQAIGPGPATGATARHGDAVAPTPGGIWRGVRIEESGPVRIRHWRAWCSSADDQSAQVAVRLVLDAAGAGAVTLRTTVGPVTDVRRQPLATGENRVELTVTIPEPELWWPWSLGDQPMSPLVVEVVDASGAPSDRRERQIGLRHVAMQDWVLSVNGRRLFAKGARQGPARALPAEADRALLAGDVALARDAGLDLLRLEAHIASPDFYDAADEAGLLIWQDLPLQGPYHRSIRSAALRQAREAVDLLAHHPSVAIWCAHDDPDGADPIGEPPMRRALSTAAPRWNRTILDGALARAIARCDDSRPIVAGSGVLPHPPSFDGSDSHLGHGWQYGSVDDLATTLAGWPRLARFVGRFGAQSLLSTALDGWVTATGGTGAADDMSGGPGPGRGPRGPGRLVGPAGPHAPPDAPSLELLAEHTGLDVAAATRLLPPGAFESLAAWCEALERYQATLVRRQVEALRRLSYRPTGGFTLAGFADAGPMAGYSVLDHLRRPKAAHEALVEACAPLIVTASPLPPVAECGQTLAVDVHVVAAAGLGAGTSVADAVLTFHPDDPDTPGTPPSPGSHRWEGPRPVDGCALVGSFTSVLPDRPGRLVVDLTLRPTTGAGAEAEPGRSGPGPFHATNRYEVTVTLP